MIQALESEEERSARRKRVAEKLSSYKKQAGLLVDPLAEAAAQDAYGKGQELMRKVCCDQLQPTPNDMLCLLRALRGQGLVKLEQEHERSCSIKLQELMTCDVQGELQAAILFFNEATQVVSYRSRVGGEATLQKAICLDSLVRCLSAWHRFLSALGEACR